MSKRKKKNKKLILQRIRYRAWLRKILKQKSKTFHPIKFNKTVGTPRIFRRTINETQKLLTMNSVNNKDKYIKNYLPVNLKYIVTKKDSPFNIESIKKEHLVSKGTILIPIIFSIIDNPEQSILVFRQMLSALLIENISNITFDYKDCKEIELGTQALFDIILKDYIQFCNRCKKISRNRNNVFPSFGATNIKDKDIQKFLWSVGSPANLGIGEIRDSSVKKFKLRTYDNTKSVDEKIRMERKDLDTTEIADYVIESLATMGKQLTAKKRDDLCTIIGEILINAEEHSTTNHRFSIGYFNENRQNGTLNGLFRLVILNFGDTIYEKFKSEDCPNKNFVSRMKSLSDKYTKKFFFIKGEFEEECLWTLYALQEGVTSVSRDSYRRGNGSIRFIESFFNIKGNIQSDNISRMNILSGKTRILFDGSYCIKESTSSNGETHRTMTFNNSGSIEDKPDARCVMCTNYYFPGTIISAELLLNEDDVKHI